MYSDYCTHHEKQIQVLNECSQRKGWHRFLQRIGLAAGNSTLRDYLVMVRKISVFSFSFSWNIKILTLISVNIQANSTHSTVHFIVGEISDKLSQRRESEFKQQQQQQQQQQHNHSC
jgi:transcription initiation factor TFIID subunit TAF12